MKKQVVITAEIRKAINRYPSGSQDGKCGEAKVIARLFYPKGDNAFYILEGGQEPGQVWDGDNVYGLCRHDGCEFEYGSFSLKEMLATKAKIEWTYGTMEVGIERDILVDPLKKTIRECMTANSEPLPAYWEDDAKPEAPATVKEEPKPVTDGPTPGGWEPELWRKMTDRNDHNGVRMAVSNWATANATAEVEEFSLLAQDFAYIASEGADSMTPELLDFRLELDAELIERIGRVFGREAAFKINGCL